MDFSVALGELKAGKRVSRDGWNGKGMYILRVGPQDWNADNDMFDERESDLECYPFLIMRTADSKLVPWLASQTDILADDWGVVP